MALTAEERRELEALRAARDAQSGGESSYIGGLGRSLTRGLTFNWGDEIGVGIAAAAAKYNPFDNFQTDDSYSQVYDKMMAGNRAKEADFANRFPASDAGAEVAGGIATGIAGASKLAGTKAGQWALSNLPRWAQASAFAAPEGFIYGAGASPGDRLAGGAQGAGVAAVAAPVAGFALEKTLDGTSSLVRWAWNKLSQTPRRQALQALRSALEAEGLNPDEAVSIYNSLGKDGMIADLGENFRALTRAATDMPGPVKSQANTALRNRQMGQGGRLAGAAEEVLGVRAKDLPKTAARIAEERFAQADPLYQQAFSQPLTMTPRLESILSRPALKTAMRNAKRIAANEGEEFAEGSLKEVHFAKRALWEQIDRAKGRAKGPLNRAYGDLLDEIGKQNDTYIQANNIWSDNSKMIDAAVEGRRFFKMQPSEMSDMLSGMSKGEQEMFRMGSMAAFQDMVDMTPMTSDATRKFIASTGALKKLETLFGDPAKAAEFVRRAQNEGSFVRTRNVVTGNSSTSANQAAGRFLEDTIQPEALVDVVVNPMGAAIQAAKTLLSKKPVSQETLKELGNILMDQGMTAQQVSTIFRQPQFQREIQSAAVPLYIRAATAVPITQAQYE